ncbi:hypothetical protein ZOSMA_39G00420 [Zostera marina]|uniref:Uncharacterized protein n=1 Tax=Zostera marina TaxID=29655 RepID=A0A0K9P6C4_ZOSMR|nr:hypothetical protein ZOSMA_39G00420 [Zostera marina]
MMKILLWMVEEWLVAVCSRDLMMFCLKENLAVDEGRLTGLHRRPNCSLTPPMVY